MDLNHYRTIVEEFDLILAHGRSVDTALTGKKPAGERQSYAGEVFVKLLAHCVTMRAIAPDPVFKAEKKLWDLGSLSAVARCVIETYDALSYVAALTAGDEERSFRLLLWSLHDSNRRMHMIQCIGKYDNRLFDLAAKEQRLHEKVVTHPHFTRIRKNLQRKVMQRDPPESYQSIKERCAEGEINHDYYTAVTMQLSQFVHTFPFAVHQLFGFKAGSPEALQLMGLPMQYAMAFLSKSLFDLEKLFPGELPQPEPDTSRKMGLWCILLKRSTKSAA